MCCNADRAKHSKQGLWMLFWLTSLVCVFGGLFLYMARNHIREVNAKQQAEQKAAK